MNEQTITISGVTCGACIKLITRILSRMKGVKNVVSVNNEGIVKVLVAAKCTKEAYMQALAGTPYRVESIS